jgi:hypothetical protein
MSGEPGIIIGVDGGATAAFAAVDYEGRVAALESRKNWPRQALVERLARYTPEVIASDTCPAGRLARELLGYFPARLHEPLESLSQQEKSELAGGALVRCRNKHERDALAAALKAWRAHANKLRQAEARALRAGVQPQDLQQHVLRGGRMDEARLPIAVRR